ncbi:MAG: folate-binding protein [Methylophilaceae bacterium]
MANNDWQAFLFTEGGVLDNGTINSFGDPEKERIVTQNDNIICDLSHLDLLELTGDDAVRFLQGQVTNDVMQLNETNAHYTGYCSPKGRLLALFLAYTQHNKLYLQLNNTLTEPITKRLKMYVMRSKVVINNLADSTVKIGLNGPDIPQYLKPFFAQIPQQAFEVIHSENATLIRLPGTTPRFEMICHTERAKEVWQALKTTCQKVGKPSWEWLEIQAGIPDIVVSTQEAFVPQMVNLEAFNAINFKKGCYTGQEIVARTHYLGKVKRRTQLAHLNTITLPSAGDDVISQNKEVVGKIVRSALAPHEGVDVLVEVRLEALESGPIYWYEIMLNIQPLPYQLEENPE